MEFAVTSFKSRERMGWANRAAPGEPAEYDANTLSGDYLPRLPMVGTPFEMMAVLADTAAFTRARKVAGALKETPEAERICRAKSNAAIDAGAK